MRSAFVTGAVTGIGEALVNKLQAEGWQVFAGYRSAGPEKASWWQEDRVIAVKCDVTNQQEIAAAVELISAKTAGKLIY